MPLARTSKTSTRRLLCAVPLLLLTACGAGSGQGERAVDPAAKPVPAHAPAARTLPQVPVSTGWRAQDGSTGTTRPADLGHGSQVLPPGPAGEVYTLSGR